MLDFYGKLLTLRQQEILDLYCNCDYSLSEIAEHLKISRQGVYDNIRRGKLLLQNYEKTLGLVERHFKNKSVLQKTLDTIDSMNLNDLKVFNREKVEKIKGLLETLIEKI